MEHSNNMDNTFKKNKEYNPNKERKTLIEFDYLILIYLVIKSLNNG